MNANELPQSTIRLMSPEDRKAFGLFDISSLEIGAGKPVEQESELHKDIMKWCDDHYFPYIRSRMDKRTTTDRGVSDIIIFAGNQSGPITLIVECKAGKNKLTEEQQSFQHRCKRWGHIAFTAWCWDDFNAVLKEVGL